MKDSYTMVLVALGLFLFTCMNFCASCTGWNAINPFCQLGYVGCIAQQTMFFLLIKFVAVVLFLIGVWKLLRGK